MTELLAPAGDLERLKIALLYGADAVYIGGRDFSLRANAKNFSLEELREAVNFAHSLNKKVYVTLNIVFHNKDIDGLDEYLKYLDEIKVDAIILSDPLVITHVKKLKLALDMYLSTQVSTLNHEAAMFWKKQGIKRVVLAREATRSDIIKIKEYTGLEIEHFIHGAMCTGVSGRCVLSNYATNRDSNRGGCAQICRWVFNAEGHEAPFTMTPKDLNMVPNIRDLIEIGVDSFKVEGRMRSIYYIATVIYVYRQIIDKIVNVTLDDAYTKYYLNILNKCANRDSTPQFYTDEPSHNEQYFIDRDEVSNQDFLGIVKSYDENNGIAVIEQRNYFKVGDVIEFFGPASSEFTMTIEEIWSEFNEPIDIARHPQMTVKMRTLKPVKEYDMMRIKSFDISDFI